MRFLLFDRITAVEDGRRVEAIKAVSLADESLRAHFSRRPLFPGSLVIESMVQALGWLAMSQNDYKYGVVLSVLEDVLVPPALEPGCLLELSGQLVGTNPKGSMGSARASIAGEEIARIGRVLYGHFPHPDPEALRARMSAFEPEGDSA